MALLLNWFRADTPLDQLDSIREQARTAGYAFGMISQDIEMGLAAQPLFPVLWEERMEQNLEELRTELGIKPVRDGQWSWESNPDLRKALGW
ncbi:MAG: Coq4 family protein [Cyanobacteriota bacterium]|nr:Coq4 family protein [Cyanobacteriota bacterium]